MEEYFLLDPLETPWTLVGRRLHPQTGRYRKIRADKERENRRLEAELERLKTLLEERS